LGRLLSRAEDLIVEGLVVRRLAQTRDGTLWKVASELNNSQVPARLALPIGCLARGASNTRGKGLENAK
jgi:hypothetical protein